MRFFGGEGLANNLEITIFEVKAYYSIIFEKV